MEGGGNGGVGFDVRIVANNRGDGVQYLFEGFYLEKFITKINIYA